MNGTSEDPREPAPFLARVAGLPAHAVERLASGLCRELEGWEEREEALQRARAGLAEQIHLLVPGAEPEMRRLLLSVRRAAFNAKPLARYLSDPRWPALVAAAPLGERVAEMEDAAAERLAAWEGAYLREHERQRSVLVESLGDRAFRRGLAMASPDLYRALGGAEAATGAASPRARRKAEANLLRYASRAATKLSPFSTFTRLALGLAEDAAPAGVELGVREWRTRSLVRVKPYLIDRCAEVLRRYPPFRDRLPVVVNSSAIEVEPERFVYLRPSYWEYDEAAARMAYHAEALVRVRLAGALVERIVRLLADGQPTYAELVRALQHELPGEAAAAAGQIEALVRIGFLVVRLPWPTQDGHLEARMLEWFRASAPVPGTAPLVEALERLVRAEREFPDAADPVAAVEALESRVDEMWAAVAPLGGMTPQAGEGRASAHNLYEDVVVLPDRERADRPGVARMPRAAAEEALRSAAPLVRLTSLFDHRHDFRTALAAHAASRWPGRRDVPLLEIFDAVQPLWKDYLRFRRAARGEGGWRSTWNPLALPEVEALAAHRERVANGLSGCGRREDGAQVISPEALDALLAPVPARWLAGDAGASLFVQPASADGMLWVLNRVKEGTGRFVSRFTPAMDAPSRRLLTEHMAARGHMEVDGEQAELLDLRCTQGDTVNIHAVQTPAVLELPGAEAESPRHRQLSLSDLRVRFGDGALPHLRDREGHRFIAVQLGFAFEDYLPTLVKFLSVFGPSEMGAVFPPSWVERRGDALVGLRTLLGSLVLHRRSWTVSTTSLAERLTGADDGMAFREVQRWRVRHGIPDQVYLNERVPHPHMGERIQPQYLDFTSPLFVALFRTALEAQGGSLTLVEALPGPSLYPRDRSGTRWAAELLVDSLAFRPHPRHAAPELLAEAAG